MHPKKLLRLTDKPRREVSLSLLKLHRALEPRAISSIATSLNSLTSLVKIANEIMAGQDL